MINMLRQLIRETIERRKFYVLVGPPGIGKGWWIRNNVPNAYIISRDNIVDDVRAPHGLKYNDLFGSGPGAHLNKQIAKIFQSRVQGAAESGQDIVVDMTNMSAAARSRAFAAIRGHEDEFEKIAVCFDFVGREAQVIASVEKRAEELGDKHIPRDVMQNMFDNFEMPTHDEGFDKIITVDPTETLTRPE